MDDATLTLRVVQVGLGLWGRSWADVVRDAEGAELAAVVDPSPEALLFAEEGGCPPRAATRRWMGRWRRPTATAYSW